MNGLSEKNGLTNHSAEPTSSSGISHHINGSTVMFHATPTKELNNGASTSVESQDDLQLSPSDLRRRSTRASALKAQEKIKLKDDIVQGPQKRTNDDDDGEVTAASVGVDGEKNPEDVTNPMKGPTAKKQKLEDGTQFDQTCFRFGLRANDDGDVYAMTDESENSSLHESEMEVVRYHYDKMMNREPDEEQLKERLKMKREAENALRNEEAQLMVLKKMKDSQNRAIAKLAAETKAADMAEVAAAYKPLIAAGKMSVNGKNQAVLNAQKTMAGLANLSTHQQLELLSRLASQSSAAKQAYLLAKKNPSQTTQLFSQLITLNSLQIQKQKEQNAENVLAQSQVQAQVQQVHQQQQQQVQITQQKLLNQQTPAQRIQQARQAFRTQADKQLMTIPTFKQQPHDVFFLPNPNASAFLALHGLDLVVQSVLRDESIHKKYKEPAYECEECKTDCSPTWKAIGTKEDGYHLYCDACVKDANKKRLRNEVQGTFKRAFQKIVHQEKEFEKKIAEGQLEQFAEAKAAAQQPMAHSSSSSSLQQIPTSSTATVSSTPLGPRLPNMPSSSGTSTPTHAMKSSTPLPSTPKSSNSNAKKPTMTPQQQQQMYAMMAQQLKANPAMQQMMQLCMQQAMTSQAQAFRNMSLNNMSTQQQQQMAIMMAQAQALVQVQQAQAAQAAQEKKEREERAKKEREERLAAQQAAERAAQQVHQQQQIQALFGAIFQNRAQQGGQGQVPAINAQTLQQLQNLNPSQQKVIAEMYRKITQQANNQK
ncbi:hypothetical protein CAEBREN_05148 [Caenorhabditis brenneri]|uniref:Uncharacterized protein n=1 Tax=Caenorhabditis brenneri TaxID=135651 RepID=G0NCW5_CAEBE|nr:hypothetical protein CAEBREN_05148 [Caenorhabditis brenneri]